MASFCFTLTEVCNWDCNYCEFPLIYNPRHTSMKILSKHLPYIKKIWDKLDDLIVHADVCGGEIGLLDSEILRYFFKTLDRPMIISTNGMFLDKGYHLDPEIKPYIKDIWLHLNMDRERNYINAYAYSGYSLKKGIVHNNADEMFEFITNSNSTFDYVEFEFPIIEKHKKDNEMYEYLYNKIKDLKNVTPEAKKRVKDRITEKDNLRQLCERYNQTVEFDLINERITLCHRSQKNWIELNEENLKKRLTKFPHYIFGNETNCESCTRLYAGRFNEKDMVNFFRIRRNI